MSDRKYVNQKPLRASAERAFANHGYNVEVVRVSVGARLTATKGVKSINVAFRTSSDRCVVFMRDDNADWRVMRDADLIVVAALGPNGADIYAFDSKPFEKAFDENLAAREANNAELSKTAPIFVCLDAVAPCRGPSATSSTSRRKPCGRRPCRSRPRRRHLKRPRQTHKKASWTACAVSSPSVSSRPLNVIFEFNVIA